MASHIISYKTLALTLGALLVLTCVTVGASYVDMGRLNVWIALGIASLKGALVVVIFMHMKYESRILVVSFISTLCFLAIMIGFTFWDIAFR
nr:cytochrome C oxidase subunit IV family protein [uncultured Desulfobacter sp.]